MLRLLGICLALMRVVCLGMEVGLRVEVQQENTRDFDRRFNDPTIEFLGISPLFNMDLERLQHLSLCALVGRRDCDAVMLYKRLLASDNAIIKAAVEQYSDFRVSALALMSQILLETPSLMQYLSSTSTLAATASTFWSLNRRFQQLCEIKEMPFSSPINVRRMYNAYVAASYVMDPTEPMSVWTYMNVVQASLISRCAGRRTLRLEDEPGATEEDDVEEEWRIFWRTKFPVAFFLKPQKGHNIWDMALSRSDVPPSPAYVPIRKAMHLASQGDWISLRCIHDLYTILSVMH